MKRMTNVIKSVVVAVGILMAAHVANAQQKFGHINSMELMEATPEFKAAEGELNTFGETKEKELQGMYAEFQKKQTELNEKALNRSEANKTTVDAEMETLGQQLQTMQQRIQEVRNKAQEEMQQKQNELFAPIQQKVLNAINSVAKEQGFAYVFDLSSGNIYPFDGSEDLTPAIKAKMGIS